MLGMEQSDSTEVVAPLLTALDRLRHALDVAMAQDNEEVSGLIVWAIRDIADVIDIADESGIISAQSRSEADAATSFSPN